MRKPIFFSLFLLLCFYSCTKIETTDIGNGLIPPIDGVAVKDTFFDVITNTFINDEIARIYKSDDHVIGVINNDPLFGKTFASVFFELKPTFFPYSFTGLKDSIVVDSAVLVLSYSGVFGDTTIPQTWRVFEINQNNKLKFDSAYGAGNTEINYGAQLGVKSSFDIRELNDSINYGLEKAQNQVRIKLNKTFADRLMKSYDSTNAYRNDSLFREFFAGFAVVPDQGMGNALIRINLLDTNTKLALYYSTRIAASEKRDTTVAYFRYNTTGGTLTSGSANVIKRDRSGSQLASYVNTGKNDSLVFVQTAPGTIVTVRIPNLSIFRNTLIHRAELMAIQAPYNTYFDATFPAPRYLLLAAYDSANKRKINVPNDYEITRSGSNIESFGGFRTNRDVAGLGTVSAYSFNLTRYVQGIVSRKDSSYNLRLYAPSNDSLYYTPPYPFATAPVPAYISPTNANTIGVGRVRLFGGKGLPEQRIRLRVIYSEL